MYKPSIGGWYALLHEGQFLTEPPTEGDFLLTKRFPLLLHIDSIRRLRFYQELLSEGGAGVETLAGVGQADDPDAYVSAAPGRGATARCWLGSWMDEASAEWDWRGLSSKSSARHCWIV